MAMLKKIEVLNYLKHILVYIKFIKHNQSCFSKDGVCDYL